MNRKLIGLAAIAAGLSFGAQAGAQETPEKAITLPPVQVLQKDVPAAKPKPRVTKAPRKQAVPAAAAQAPAQGVDTGENTVGLSPVKGSEIAIHKVPGAVSQVSGADVQANGAPSVQDSFQQRVPGIILSDVQGNAFQTSVQYRGFESSPVNGTPQGLAVYQNGVRVNEVFGDVVNWDFLPGNAIDGMTVISGNPIFGLNALGGAVSIKMKDGFGFQGVESDTRFGSWGRRQEAVQAGQQAGNFAAYIALEGIKEDGWRDASPSSVNRMYADIGAKGRNESEIHLNYTAAANFVGAAAPSPKEMLAQDWSKVFTSPQTTFNRMSMTSLNGTVAVTDDWKLSGVGYYRQFRQKHVDGNISDVAACAADPALLCLNDEIVKDRNGNNILANQFPEQLGEIDRTTNQADSFGGTMQATNKARLFGHGNQFVIGASIDHGTAKTTSSADLGTIDENFKITGSGIHPFYPLAITPVNLKTTTDYTGVFFIDTFDITDRLTVTAGGRYNYAKIRLDDRAADFKAAAFPGEESSLTGDHTYDRFNPSAGATYKLTPGLTLYGGYSEANRAPTPAELACSNPNQPCLLENFLVSDPELKQVISRTWEAGLRGSGAPQRLGGKVDWSLGLFHTMNTNDIINVLDPNNPTRGYFRNAGNTLRQGVEASVSYKTPRAQLYANYAFVDATFGSDLTLPSPNNPQADSNAADPYSINVRKGDHLPAIAAHRIKAGIDYRLTDAWKAGADVVYSSSQYYVGDENNQNAKLPGYAVVNLHTSYDITKRVQIYGLVNNVFDNKYALYGTYFQAADAGFTDARTETPAAPLSVYGGMKIKF
jgi:iron complex outermembrane recepter protein